MIVLIINSSDEESLSSLSSLTSTCSLSHPLHFNVSPVPSNFNPQNLNSSDEEIIFLAVVAVGRRGRKSETKMKSMGT